MSIPLQTFNYTATTASAGTVAAGGSPPAPSSSSSSFGLPTSASAPSSLATDMSPRPKGFPSHTEILLRKPETSHMALKEKFVAVYEAFFKGEDPTGGSEVFWEELFLLKVNIKFLDRCFLLTGEEQLLALKSTFNLIFHHCLLALKDDNIIRCVHGFETMATMLRAIFRKKFNNFGFEVISLICGMDNADQFFTDLLRTTLAFIDSRQDFALKSLGMTLLIVLGTATENVNQNALMEYMLQVDMVSSILKLLRQVDPSLHPSLLFDGVVLLALLVNYHKYESRNSTITRVSEITDQTALIGLARTLSQHWDTANSKYRESTSQNAGLLSTIGSYFTSFLPTSLSGGNVSNVNLHSHAFAGSGLTASTLLAFYEAVHLNPAFAIGMISGFSAASAPVYPPPPAPPPSSSATATTSSSSPGSPILGPVPLASSRAPAAAASAVGPTHANVFAKFLEFCGLVFTELPDQHTLTFAKLSLLVLLTVTEANNLNKLLHDPANSITLVPSVLPRPNPKEKFAPITVVLDLVIHFIKNNLKKPLQVDLYMKAFGVIRRILCYQKKFRVRLNYSWNSLWNSLFLVFKFLGTAEMIAQPGNVAAVIEVATIFNLFITYGDTFLPSPADYDELYYELIRVRKLIDHFYQTADTHDTTRTVILYLDNIKTIIRHFSAKIDQWQEANTNSTLTQEQVVHIIRNNYESLKLNLMDALDLYEPFLENPHEVQFFRKYLRVLVSDYKALIEVQPVEIRVL